MRTTLDIPDELIQRAIDLSGAKTKREAVCWALEESVRRRAIDDLLNLKKPIEFDITPEQLDAEDLKAQHAKRKRKRRHRR